jgi:uncharacterized phage protein (TIGR01671 family)
MEIKTRPIKFRAWDGGMYYNVLVDGNAWTDNIVIDIWHTGNIMQFTGLVDLNGKEIYEGDILKRSDGVIKYVFFNEKQGGFYTQFLNGAGFIDPIKYATDRDCVIIGNIYQNPELLK